MLRDSRGNLFKECVDLEIKVTQRDLYEGECHNGNACPVARALRRGIRKRLPDVYGELKVMVGELAIRYRVGSRTLFYDFGDDLREFINRFDKPRRNPEPKSFVVKVPDVATMLLEVGRPVEFHK